MGENFPNPTFQAKAYFMKVSHSIGIPNWISITEPRSDSKNFQQTAFKSFQGEREKNSKTHSIWYNLWHLKAYYLKSNNGFRVALYIGSLEWIPIELSLRAFQLIKSSVTRYICQVKYPKGLFFSPFCSNMKAFSKLKLMYIYTHIHLTESQTIGLLFFFKP